MWCSNCQQDTPAVAHALHGRIVCSQCQQPMRSSTFQLDTQISDNGIALDGPEMASSHDSAPPRTRQWSVRDRARLLNTADMQHRPSSARKIATRRFDPPQITFDDIKLATSPEQQVLATQLSTVSGPAVRRRPEGGQFSSWLLVVAGALALVGGIGAIAWSLSAGRPDIWNLALALTLGGQGTLILGLVLVVARLWRNSRYATGKLQTVNAQLVQLQRTADELAAMRGGAQAFYADLARGASPQVLLANLKGQLDQLTTRMGG